MYGHWLNILITRSSCKNIQTHTSRRWLIGPYHSNCNLKVPIDQVLSKHNAFYRAIHSINIAAFMTDIITSDLVTHPKEHVSDLYTNTTFKYLRNCLTNTHPLNLNLCHKSRQLLG
ncbi:hypothetical protein NP493_1143g01041 [Ridgeia piscesae]|uniref:Uncharacterized protein n=1 Tax=Ridgeia piscesae TaxID=27915 RepID=A0AAD9NJF5_RIDPI|nr:hypothetical protein NP493_1143g01041 [Ridgeia piscesae]